MPEPEVVETPESPDAGELDVGSALSAAVSGAEPDTEQATDPADDPEPKVGEEPVTETPETPEAQDDDVLKAFSDEEPAKEEPAPETPPEDELAAFREWKAAQAKSAATPEAPVQPTPTEPVALDITQEEFEDAILGEGGLESFKAMLGKAAAVGGANALLTAKAEIAQAQEQLRAEIGAAREELFHQTTRQLDWAMSAYYAYRQNPEIKEMGEKGMKAFVVAYNKAVASGVPNDDAADQAVASWKANKAIYDSIQKSGNRIDLRAKPEKDSRPLGGGRDVAPKATEDEPFMRSLNSLLGGKS